MARNGNFKSSHRGADVIHRLHKKLTGSKGKARNTSSNLHTFTSKYHSALSNKEQRKRHVANNAPRSRFKRILWYLNPVQSVKYFFGTREGRLKLLKLAGAGIAALLIMSVGVYAFFRGQVPDPSDVNSRTLAQTTKFYDSSGKKLLFELYGDQNRTVVKSDQISKYMKDATVAIEDKDFYEHDGFSLRGISRAFVNNLTSQTTQGGSTITQQYVKNALLSNDRIYTRKIKELILSLEMERLYTKEEILTAYLNEIPYGSLEYGVEAASESFFDKSAKDLTLDEAALLAALPQAPSQYSPYSGDTSLLEARQDTVIGRMADQGYITSDAAKKAKKVNTLKKLNRNRNKFDNVTAPHFVLEAQKELEQEFGGSATVNQSGWKVTTTLDLKLQKTAEKVAKNNLGLVEGVGADNLAITVGDQKNGHIKAMVGSRDFDHPKYGAYNAAKANRQPGSSFKPYAYAELFETGKWGPGSIVYDLKTNFDGYTPKNFNAAEQNGAITIRRALGRSLNIPAVKALYIAGIDNVIDQAKAQGISTLNDRERFGLALVLGAGEVKLADHVTGYEAFANGGTHYPQTYIKKIEKPTGEVVPFKEEARKGKRVLDEQVAYMISDTLSDRSVRTGVLNNVQVNAAVKTGTTSNVKDLWTMGYSDHITAGVWVGNHDNTEMATSSSLAIAPIWVQLMNEMHAEKNWQSREFKKPEGIKTVTLDGQTGKAPTSATTTTVRDIVGSNYKTPKSGKKTSYTVDSISGKLATNCTPESTKERVTGDGIEPEIPSSDPQYNEWAKPIRAYASRVGRSFGGGKPSGEDDIHKCSDNKPRINDISVEEVSGSRYKISAKVTKGTHPLKNIKIRVDGREIYSRSIGSSGVYETTTSARGGSNTVRVTVADSVGYSSEASTTFKAGSGIRGIAPTGQTGTSVTFRWSGGTGPYRVFWSGADNGSRVFNGSQGNVSLDPGNYTWYVRDSEGNTSSPRSFKVEN